jgi:MFS family permease
VTRASIPLTPLDTPLGRPAFRWFFAGRLVSMLGTSLSSVALAFAVLDASGTAGDLGLVLAAHSVALIVFLLAGGVVADRLPRSTVLVGSHLGAGITQGALAAVLLTGSLGMTVVAALSGLNGVLTAFTMPALRGIVPELVDAAHLQRANALLSTAGNATKVLGPTVAGVLAATAGGGWALALDALSYVLAAGLLTRLRLAPRRPLQAGSLLGDLRTGWHAFRSTTWVWAVTGAFLFINLVQQGAWSVLGPDIARATFGEAAWGLVLSGRAVGLVVTGAVMYRVLVRYPLRAGQVASALLALPLLVLGTGAPVGWIVAAACVAGAGSAVAAICWDTALQEHVPREVLSRVSSYDQLGSFVGMPVGQAVAGPLALAFGHAPVLMVAAVSLAILALVPLTARSVRDLRHVPASA